MGVISTALGLVLISVFRVGFVLIFDMIINIVCLFVMHRLWKPAFIIFCTPLMRCVVSRDEFLSGLLASVEDEHDKQKQFAHEFILNPQVLMAHRILSFNDSTIELSDNTASI